MKKLFSLALVLSFIVVTAHISYATHVQSTAGTVAGGIADSRHNFSSSGVHFRSGETGGGVAELISDLGDGQGTTEICVFCHTPHHGNSTGPIWNKSASTTLTGYGTTVAGTSIGAPTGASLACLSCHDGANTFDNIINAPGKGTWTGSAWTSGITGAGVDMPWEFSEDGSSKGDSHSDTTSSRHNLARGGLANDHPISVSYYGEDTAPGLMTGARASLRSTSTTISSIDLDTDVSGVPLVEADGGSPNLWAINGFIKSDATISDLLRTGGQVECSSCHDPHYRNQTNPEIDITYGATTHSTDFVVNDVDGLFLRRVGGNSDSGLCRTCHNK